jgi:formyltetrahydrofolate-dependent phosphoribosylglycinamide formyltransferase
MTMIRTAEEVAQLRDQLDAEGSRLVFTNGCFDLLHAGHVRYLAEARALGDALVIGLNSDASVRALKGQGRPLNSAEDRAEVLAGLRSVDAVAVFEGERATALIETIRPHVYAKGGDYTPETLNPEERAALDAAGTQIEILSLVPGKSTSATIAAMDAGSDSRFKIGVLGSGKGTKLDDILAAIDAGGLDVELAVVISDVADAPILGKARARGISALHVDPGPHPQRLALSAQKEIADRLKASGVDLVVCAGFLKILKAPLIDAFPDRIINVHPSLLPKHKGLNAAAQALAAGDSETGCTVHLVSAELDGGRILGQSTVPVLPSDTEASLYARIQQAEGELLPAMIGRFVDGIF